ncbi:MAG: hypothetical protein M3R01_08240 [Actinomycetota bacterium]|nr:hypothetical protein [Actinomycetota bacterium]
MCSVFRGIEVLVYGAVDVLSAHPCDDDPDGPDDPLLEDADIPWAAIGDDG